MLLFSIQNYPYPPQSITNQLGTSIQTQNERFVKIIFISEFSSQNYPYHEEKKLKI